MEILSQLGLTDIEQRVYLALLESGPITPLELSNRYNISRSTVYQKVTALEEKSLVTWKFYGNIKKAIALDPSQIEKFIENEEHKAKNLRIQFNQDLPLLKDTYSSTSKEGIKTEAIHSGREIEEFITSRVKTKDLIFLIGDETAERFKRKYQTLLSKFITWTVSPVVMSKIFLKQNPECTYILSNTSLLTIDSKTLTAGSVFTDDHFVPMCYLLIKSMTVDKS